MNLLRDRRWIWGLLALANLVALYLQWTKGGWLYRADGSLYAHDFISFWAAGQRALAGEGSLVYDRALQIAFQTALIDAPKPVDYGFFYPPHFLFLTLPFAKLGLVQAYLAFLAAGVALYAMALKLVARSWSEALLAAVAGGGAYICMLWVQNGFLTGALIVAGLVLVPSRPALAGVLLGLLTVKPQLGLLIPLALAAGGYWRAFGWAAGTCVFLALAAELAFGPGIWSAFILSWGQTADFLQAGTLWFKMQTLFALTLPIFGKAGAYAVQAIVALGVAWIIIGLWRNPSVSHWLKCAAVIAGSLLMSPYLFPYDAVPLTAAALMLLRENPRLPLPEQALLFAACILPGLTDFLLSAAVPIAAAAVLILILRQVDRSQNANELNPT